MKPNEPPLIDTVNVNAMVVTPTIFRRCTTYGTTVDMASTSWKDDLKIFIESIADKHCAERHTKYDGNQLLLQIFVYANGKKLVTVSPLTKSDAAHVKADSLAYGAFIDEWPEELLRYAANTLVSINLTAVNQRLILGSNPLSIADTIAFRKIKEKIDHDPAMHQKIIDWMAYRLNLMPWHVPVYMIAKSYGIMRREGQLVLHVYGKTAKGDVYGISYPFSKVELERALDIKL